MPLRAAGAGPSARVAALGALLHMALVTVLTAPLAAQDTAATAPLDRAVRAYASVRTLRARFEQTLTNPITKTSRTARGEYLQEGRRRFALRFTDPAGDAIVSDDQALWMYLPSAAKGQVIKAPPAAGAGLDLLTELLSAPRQNYSVQPLADDSIGTHATAVYRLTPRSANGAFSRAVLWIGRDDALLWQLEVDEPSALIRRVRFTSIATNVPLPKEAMTFSPPPGVRIVDQAAMLGGKPNNR